MQRDEVIILYILIDKEGYTSFEVIRYSNLQDTSDFI